MINKHFGKLIGNKLFYAQNPLSRGEVMISNPSKAEYCDAGYKPIIYTQKPEEEGFLFSHYFVIEGNNIVEKWRSFVLPKIDDGDILDLD